MKVNNIVLFALLVMLSNVSFAKNLNKSGQPFKSIGDKPIPGQVYYISGIAGRYLMSNPHENNKFIKPVRIFEKKRRANLSWIFEQNKDGSYSIKNGQFNKYLTTYDDGGYELLSRNQNNPGQNFIYENRSIKSTKTNQCMEVHPDNKTPNGKPCPQPLDIKY